MLLDERVLLTSWVEGRAAHRLGILDLHTGQWRVVRGLRVGVPWIGESGAGYARGVVARVAGVVAAGAMVGSGACVRRTAVR